MKKDIITIDATDKSLGRLASEVSILLRGKNKPNFNPAKDSGCFVIVKNFKKVKISGSKMEDKKYFSHTGMVGREKFTPLKTLFEKNPEKVLKRAVLGMLPKNRLSRTQIKRLKVEE